MEMTLRTVSITLSVEDWGVIAYEYAFGRESDEDSAQFIEDMKDPEQAVNFLIRCHMEEDELREMIDEEKRVAKTPRAKWPAIAEACVLTELSLALMLATAKVVTLDLTLTAGEAGVLLWEADLIADQCDPTGLVPDHRYERDMKRSRAFRSLARQLHDQGVESFAPIEDYDDWMNEYGDL